MLKLCLYKAFYKEYVCCTYDRMSPLLHSSPDHVFLCPISHSILLIAHSLLNQTAELRYYVLSKSTKDNIRHKQNKTYIRVSRWLLRKCRKELILNKWNKYLNWLQFLLWLCLRTFILFQKYTNALIWEKWYYHVIMKH